VGDRLVLVRVRMPDPGRQARMHVRVVSVVVPVLVRVGHGFVRVLVPVARREHERDPRHHESGGAELGCRRRLAEHEPGEEHARNGDVEKTETGSPRAAALPRCRA
jgi:hypothetical protein